MMKCRRKQATDPQKLKNCQRSIFRFLLVEAEAVKAESEAVEKKKPLPHPCFTHISPFPHLGFFPHTPIILYTLHILSCNLYVLLYSFASPHLPNPVYMSVLSHRFIHPSTLILSHPSNRLSLRIGPSPLLSLTALPSFLTNLFFHPHPSFPIFLSLKAYRFSPYIRSHAYLTPTHIHIPVQRTSEPGNRQVVDCSTCLAIKRFFFVA